MFWCILYYLRAFGTVWLRYNTLCKMDQTGAKVHATKSHRNFSQRMHLIHPHCTLNTCFGVFCTIWMYLEPFGCHTKLGAKRAEEVQKFVTRSRIGIFRNKRTRSTPLDPNLTFRCISYYLDSATFGCLPTLGAKRAELVQKFVPRNRIGIFYNERTRSTPLDPKLTFRCVFRTI